jgi:hypothetical protein
MKIALDYDGTYTADPQFWTKVISLAAEHGHTVQCVTMRYSHEPIDVPCEVIYTARKAKTKVHDADVWIDDEPTWLLWDAA